MTLGLSACSPTQTRTLFEDKAALASLASMPCSVEVEYDSVIETISCMNDNADNVDSWLVKKYPDEGSLRYAICSSPSDEPVLVGVDWSLWWVPVPQPTMEAIQKQLGGEILKLSDYCGEQQR